MNGFLYQMTVSDNDTLQKQVAQNKFGLYIFTVCFFSLKNNLSEKFMEQLIHCPSSRFQAECSHTHQTASTLHKSGTSFARSSFTLIELLVVIAIIALLAAMLMPALQQARERGRQAFCQSNFRQTGNAAAAYADQYKGWTPFHYTSGDTVFEGYANKAQGGAWYVMLAPFLGFSTYSYYNLSQIQGQNVAITKPIVFSCPTIPVEIGTLSGGAKIDQAPSNSAKGNKALSMNGQTFYRVRHNRVMYPSFTVFMLDSAKAENFTINMRTVYDNKWANFRYLHANGTKLNLLHFDGHVSSSTWSLCYTQITSDRNAGLNPFNVTER